MLDKLTQLHKSKFFKCFLIAVVLVFSYEVSKPKAIAPLAGLIINVASGIIVGELVEMGVKAGSKAVIKKQADNFAEMALNEKNIYGLNFAKQNPYRNKDGSLVISPSVNDYAKLAGIGAGGLAGYLLSMDADGDGVLEGCTPIPVGATRLSFQPKGYYSDGSGDVTQTNKNWDSFAKSNITAYKMSLSSTQDVIYFKSNITGNIIDQDIVNNVTTYAVFASSDPNTSAGRLGTYYRSSGSIQTGYMNQSITPEIVGGKTFGINRDAVDAAGAGLQYCGDLAIPSTINNVYQPPLDMPDSYSMPNAAAIKNPPVIINNFFPPSETEGPVTWNEINDSFNDEEINNIINNHIDNSIKNGDIINNPITVGEINNQYTDILYPIKVPDFKPPTEEIKPPDILPPVVTPDPDVPAIPNEDVDDLDHSMWQVMRNTYNYLDDGIDSSLSAMKGITDSASGITSYLGQTMGWLPPEWRAVFTSAFVLGVFAHFLRR